MKYKLVRSRSKLAQAGKMNYLAQVKPEATYDIDDLSVALASLLPGGKAQVTYYETMRAQAIEAALKDGKAVRIGGVNLVPVVKGGFSTVDGEFDAARNKVLVTAFASGELKKCLSDTIPTNVEAAANPTLSHIREEGADEEERLLTGRDITITGRNLKVDATAEDEGVVLEDLKTGEVKATATLELSNFDSLLCSFATLPSKGRYWLVVNTRSGLDREHKVVRAAREVKVGEEA